jgi:hypothetical protein
LPDFDKRNPTGEHYAILDFHGLALRAGDFGFWLDPRFSFQWESKPTICGRNAEIMKLSDAHPLASATSVNSKSKIAPRQSRILRQENPKSSLARRLANERASICV